jgi:putative phosphoribosyl transferase
MDVAGRVLEWFHWDGFILVRCHLGARICILGADCAAGGVCTVLFRDRFDAGQRLGAQLHEFANRRDVLVLALPRGGVPVGFEVARLLNTPLDIFVVRKIGAPGQEELAMGAIASGDVQILNSDVIREFHISAEQVREAATRERLELKRREALYRRDRSSPDVRDMTVILVDDGLATGSTMRVAIAALRREHTKQIIAAVPVAASSVRGIVALEAEGTVCLYTPVDFYAVGQWYQNFSQTTDEEVRDLLARSIKAAEPIVDSMVTTS